MKIYPDYFVKKILMVYYSIKSKQKFYESANGIGS